MQSRQTVASFRQDTTLSGALGTKQQDSCETQILLQASATKSDEDTAHCHAQLSHSGIACSYYTSHS